MPENPDCVVVVSRRYLLGVCACPLLAIGLGDLTNFRFVQTRPAFDQCAEALSPIMARARFDAQVIIEVPEMNGGSLAEGHLGRDFAVSIVDALAMLFEKFSKFGLRHAKM